MDTCEPSSLDRFLWRRAQDLLDSRMFRRDSKGTIAVGIVQIACGSALLGYAVLYGGDATIVLATAGLVLVGIGALVQRNALSRLSLPVVHNRQLVAPSSEGQRLLHKICSHIGYYNYQEEVYGRSLVGVRGLRTSSQILRSGLFGLLDSAAFQFNRIDGLLRERSAASDAGLRSLAPAARAASLEAMAHIVNHAAWIDTYPENADDHRTTIELKTVKLRELADRLSGLAGSPPGFSDAIASRTLMDDVLDKLILEEQARAELVHSPSPSASRHHRRSPVDSSTARRDNPDGQDSVWPC